MALFGPADISCLLARRIVSDVAGTHKATRWAIKVSRIARTGSPSRRRPVCRCRISNLPPLAPEPGLCRAREPTSPSGINLSRRPMPPGLRDPQSPSLSPVKGFFFARPCVPQLRRDSLPFQNFGPLRYCSAKLAPSLARMDSVRLSGRAETVLRLDRCLFEGYPVGLQDREASSFAGNGR
jgi:hypothetical protein